VDKLTCVSSVFLQAINQILVSPQTILNTKESLVGLSMELTQWPYREYAPPPPMPRRPLSNVAEETYPVLMILYLD
jgi:hypothetical protein